MNVNSFPKTSFDRVLIIQILKILDGVLPPKIPIRGEGACLQQPQNPSYFYIAPSVLCYKKLAM